MVPSLRMMWTICQLPMLCVQRQFENDVDRMSAAYVVRAETVWLVCTCHKLQCASLCTIM